MTGERYCYICRPPVSCASVQQFEVHTSLVHSFRVSRIVAEEVGRQMGEAMTKPREKLPMIYLAGCLGDWREGVIGRWDACLPPVATVIDPFEESNQQSLANFVIDDLELVRTCDLLLAYHAYHVFDGLAAECGYAYAKGIPIVYVCRQPRVSSFIAGMSKAVFTKLTPALEYIEKKYLNQKPQWEPITADKLI